MEATGVSQTTLPITPATPRRWLDVLLLTIVLAVALAIRLTHVDANLSFDELWHIGTTKAIGNSLAVYQHNVVYDGATDLTSLDHSGPVWAVWTRSMDGVLHPPLFVVALRVWRDVAGESDFAAHLFSIAWSLVAIVFTFLTARLAFDRWLAALLALSMACSQTQVYFAQEVRAYEMLIAIGTIALWLMTRIEVLGATRRRLVALGLLTLPLQLTHYFAFGGALAIVVYGLVRAGKERQWFIGSVVSAVAIFLATWLKFALRQIKDISTGDAFLHVAHRDIVHEMLLVLGTPFRLIAERDYQMELTPVYSGVLFVLPWLLVRKFKPLLPWAIWLSCAVLPLVVLDMARSTVHVALIRYLAIATPAVPLLFAGVVWPVRRWLAMVVAVVICATGAIYLASRNGIALDADDFSPVVRALEPRIAPGDVIATYAGFSPLYYADVLMLTMSHSPKLFPRTILVMDRPMTGEEAATLAGRRVWLVGGGLDMPIERLIAGAKPIALLGVTPQVNILSVQLDAAAGRPEAANRASRDTTLPATAPAILPP